MTGETFADRLRMAMEQQGKKQIDIIHDAALRGVKIGKSHISQYVSGKNVPRAEILHCLAQVLDVEEEWLRSGRQEKSRQGGSETQADRPDGGRLQTGSSGDGMRQAEQPGSSEPQEEKKRVQEEE